MNWDCHEHHYIVEWKNTKSITRRMFQNIKIYNQLFIRLLIIIIGISVAFYFLQKNLIYTAIFSFFIIIVFLIELYLYLKNAFLFYDKTIKAILQNDFSSDFSKHQSIENYQSLFTLYNY